MCVLVLTADNEERSRIYLDAKRLEAQIHAGWKAAGVFASPDPYAKPARKSVPRATSSATPAPSTTSAPAPVVQAPSVVISPSPVPTPAPAPVAAPTPSPAPAPAPLPQHPPAAPPAPIALPSAAGPSAQVLADRAVITALDTVLPRWQGPEAVLPGPPIEGIPGSGWWGEADHVANAGPSDRMRSVLNTLEHYRHDNVRLAEVFDLIPPVAAIPYLSFNGPVTFSSIKINANANRYRTLRDVDIDMARLFEKARRFFPEGSSNYGKVFILQRLYNALTAQYPLLPPIKQSPTLFSSIPAGPGNAKSQHEMNLELRAGAAEQEVGYGITTFRVGTKDRVWTTEARHKGMAYRVGECASLIRYKAHHRRFCAPDQPGRRGEANRRADLQGVCPDQGTAIAPCHRVLVSPPRTDGPHARPDILRPRGVQDEPPLRSSRRRYPRASQRAVLRQVDTRQAQGARVLPRMAKL